MPMEPLLLLLPQTPQQHHNTIATQELFLDQHVITQQQDIQIISVLQIQVMEIHATACTISAQVRDVKHLGMTHQLLDVAIATDTMKEVIAALSAQHTQHIIAHQVEPYLGQLASILQV
jgi:hypothetical protein